MKLFVSETVLIAEYVIPSPPGWPQGRMLTPEEEKLIDYGDVADKYQ